MLESLFSKVAGLEACFPMNFAKLLRTFLTEQLWWLLLIILSLSIYIYRERERICICITSFRYKCDYLCETLLKTNVATDEGKDRNEM